MSKKIRLLLLVILGLALPSAAGAYVWSRRGGEEPLGPTVQVRRGNLTETAAASGKIAPAVQVEVKSRASGEVAEVLVKEGDRVEAGQLLIRLDKVYAKRDLEAAKVARSRAIADLKSAEASARVAALDQQNNQTSEELAKKSVELGVGATDTVRSATHATQVAAANASLRKAQSESSRLALQTAELGQQDAETRLKETDIYAPVAGTILSMAVEKGTIVSSALTNVGGGSAVLTIADLTDLRIIGSIDEAQISRVAPGQKVDIRVDAYPTRVFEGVVDRVSPLGVETSSVVNFDVEIKIVDKEVALLRSGMSADVEIVTAEQKDVLLVPLAALQTKDRKHFVRLANGQERAVKIGTTDGTRMVVLQGLAEGDEILAAAPLAKTEGAAQKPAGQSPMRGMGMGAPGGRR